MGKFRKLAIIAIAIVTMFAMTIPAMAAESPTNGSSNAVAKAKITSTDGSVKKATIVVNYSGDNAAKYRIAYRTEGGKWTYKTVSSKSYTIKGKKKGLYEIRVAGISKDGKVGAYSKSTYRYINGAKVTVKGKKKAMKVKAKKVKGATGYYINYSKNKNMSKAKVKKVKTKKALNKTIKKLKKGKYYVQVRPYKVKGGKTYVGIALNKKAVKVK